MPPPHLPLEDAVAHLRGADAKLARVIDEVGPIRLGARPRFASLVRAIVGQQLSTKAARSIYARLLDVLGTRYPTPEGLLALSADELRAVGLAWSKVRSLHDLAEHVADRRLRLHALPRMEDEAIIEALTQVRGIGRWTAEMFLMFTLKRPDVLPVDDLGIQNGFVRVYNLRKRPTPARMHKLAAPWRPYRTVGSCYLWRSLDVMPQ